MQINKRLPWQDLSFILQKTKVRVNLIEQYVDDDTLDMAYIFYQRQGRVLDYHNLSELFEAGLDEAYTMDNVS